MSQMQKTQDGQVTRIFHPTLGSLIEECRDGEFPSGWNQGNLKSLTKGKGDNFRYFQSFDEAMDAGYNGWKEGAQKMLRTVEAAATATSFATQPAFMLDVGGAYPFIPAACAGSPGCMVSPIPVEDRKRPIVRIIVDNSTPYLYSVDELFNYGAGLCAYVDALERNNFRCEIETIISSTAGGTRISATTRIKEADEVLDMDRVAFALANPDFLRRLFFRQVEQNMSEISYSFGYGSTFKVERGKDYEEDQILLPGIVQQPAGSDHWKSPEASLKEMSQIIEKLLRDRYEDLPELNYLVNEIQDKAA